SPAPLPSPADKPRVGLSASPIPRSSPPRPHRPPQSPPALTPPVPQTIRVYGVPPDIPAHSHSIHPTTAASLTRSAGRPSRSAPQGHRRPSSSQPDSNCRSPRFVLCLLSPRCISGLILSSTCVDQA